MSQNAKKPNHVKSKNQKKPIEMEYDRIVKIIVKKVGHNKSTFSDKLNKLGKELFGTNKFKGVYSYDKIPSKNDFKINESCIFNLDPQTKPGSHWCALYFSKNKKFILYDSFGRNIQIPNKKVIHTEKDAEQIPSEDNCGQRCLAWLFLLYKHGLKYALEI